MKKLLALGIAFAMVGALIPAVSGNTETIEVNMTPSGTIDITVNESYLNISALASSATAAVNILNDGDVNVLVNISATDTTDWNLTDGNVSSAHDQFNLTHLIDGETETAITTSDATFISNFAYDGDTNFNLTVRTPASTSTNDVQTSTITFTATAL